MEVELKIPVPGYLVPESMVFGHTTRLLDSWTPEPERIVRPALEVSSAEIVIRAFKGNTFEHGTQKRTKNLARMLRRRQTLSMEGRYIYDSRHDTDRNIAHHIDSHAARVLLAREKLKAALGRDVQIHLILRSGAIHFAQALHHLLGIPVITTDARVEGTIVQICNSRVDTRVEGKVIQTGGSSATNPLLPEIFGEFQNVTGADGTHEKIFISRKGSRTVSNETEITDLLESQGFQKVYFEDISVSEQCRVFGNAREIISIHGAAMAFLVFNRNGLARPRGDFSGLRLIELFGAGYLSDMYRRMAAVMNAHWCGVRGKIKADDVRDLDERNLPRAREKSSFRIDPLTLKMAIDHVARACELKSVPCG
jgi:Glycosyltransferase 61